jgi:hypothetical protein
MKTKIIVCIIAVSALYSCSKKEILEKDGGIIISESNRYISTKDRLVVVTSTSFTEGDKSDTLKIQLSDKDWNILQKSFTKNQIFSISNNHPEIGEKSNSIIPFPKKIEIKTNKRNLTINYNYFVGNEKIDTVKSKNLKQFMRTFDSIIYYKTIK